MKELKKVIAIILFIAICCWLVYKSFEQTLLNSRLKSENNKIRAVVTNKYKVGSKGTIQIDYSFTLSGKIYSGQATNKRHNIGDSLDILYLKENPELNKSYSFIQEK
jgi:uncharacterized protein YneF (UPF0154 family)